MAWKWIYGLQFPIYQQNWWWGDCNWHLLLVKFVNGNNKTPALRWEPWEPYQAKISTLQHALWLDTASKTQQHLHSLLFFVLRLNRNFKQQLLVLFIASVQLRHDHIALS